jgi:hypothetical protein
MPLVINSAPDCITHVDEAKPADDVADFILQANYQDCAGFMTFGPGSTYGDEGAGADSLYMILTWLGIVVTIAVLVAWVVYENRQFIHHMARRGAGVIPPDPGPPPQPGGREPSI